MQSLTLWPPCIFLFRVQCFYYLCRECDFIVSNFFVLLCLFSCSHVPLSVTCLGCADLLLLWGVFLLWSHFPALLYCLCLASFGMGSVVSRGAGTDSILCGVVCECTVTEWLCTVCWCRVSLVVSSQRSISELISSWPLDKNVRYSNHSNDHN